MRILHLSDTHRLHGQLRDMSDADVLVHSGDFTLEGAEKEVTDFYGSPELLVKVSEIAPRLHLFGHVHGARGILDDGHTVFVNSALASENYTALSFPRVINI